MPDLLTGQLANTLADLADRSGLLSQPPDRQAMLIEIGLNPSNYSFYDATPHNFAVLLIHEMNQQDNRDALGRMFLKIADRMPGQRDEWPVFEEALGVRRRESNRTAVPQPVAGQPAADTFSRRASAA